MVVRIITGDCRDVLATLPAESVHCVVTSPPYFGLRDYGMDAQIGLEATPDAYVAEMVSLFRSVRRVLRSDGTFWLNLGDSYSNQGKWGGATGGKATKGNHGANGSRDKREYGLPFKQRLMIPARVALALQADGWWLRDEIIWHKPNPMPVSVTDRTTPAHEMLYMLTKSARYHYDMTAIKEPCQTHPKERYHERARITGRGDQGYAAARGNDRGKSGGFPVTDRLRQPRSVWSITTRPFKGAHFATFPPDLVRPCILAGCPEGGTVLDPFAGAGTTGIIADQLGRDALLIELNEAYATMARDRIRNESPLFVAAE